MNTGPSRAQKYLAALAKFGGVEVDEDLVIDGVSDDELELIFEQEFAKHSSEERKNDDETLSKRVQLEFISSERKRLSAAIEKAEADGNDEEMRRLMLEMNKLIKK
jgi:hypothetical protein